MQKWENTLQLYDPKSYGLEMPDFTVAEYLYEQHPVAHNNIIPDNNTGIPSKNLFIDFLLIFPYLAGDLKNSC